MTGHDKFVRDRGIVIGTVQNEVVGESGPVVDLIYTFGEFRADSANRTLSCNGKDIPTTARVFDCLLFLLRHSGDLVSKDALLGSVWAQSFVEEANLTVAISTLRRLIGEDPRNPRYIQTQTGRGYRFIGQVEVSLPTRRPAAKLSPEVPQADLVSQSLASLVPDGLDLLEPASAPPQLVSRAEEFDRLTPRWLMLWFTVAACALIAIFLTYRYRRHESNPSIHSIAVLPLTGASVDDDVLLGLTDTLIQRASESVVVRPMSSVLKYSRTSFDPYLAAREQNADAVIIGSFLRTAGSTRLELKLLRTQGHAELWSRSFEEKSQNLAALQDRVGKALDLELRDAAGTRDEPLPAAAAKPATNEQAYRFYLRGRYFWNRRTEEGLHQSIEAFRESISADPNYAPAYAGLADSYALLASFSVESGKSSNPDARAAALSAIQLDPTLAEPHASLGMIYFFTEWNGPAAEAEFERAIALNPNYATAHHWYALDLAAMGRFPESLYEIRRAQALDPLSLIIATNVGWIEYLNRQYKPAQSDYHAVLELDPSFVRALTRMGIDEVREGETNAAIEHLRAAQKLSTDPFILALLGQALAQSGRTAAAEHVLAQLKTMSATKYVPPYSLALVSLGLHRNADAIAELGQAIEDHSTSMVYAKVDPSLDSLRDDPAFQNLLKGMRF